jgi:hypothetical protein
VPFVAWLPNLNPATVGHRAAANDGPVAEAPFEARRVARRPSFVTGSKDGRLRVFCPLRPSEAAARAAGRASGNGGASVGSVTVDGHDGSFSVSTSAGKLPSAELGGSVHTAFELGSLGSSEENGRDGLAWTVVQSVRAHRTGITCGAVSLDGRWLATACSGMVTRAAVTAKETPVLRIWALHPKTAGTRWVAATALPADPTPLSEAAAAAAAVEASGLGDDGLVDFEWTAASGAHVRAAAAAAPTEGAAAVGEAPEEFEEAPVEPPRGSVDSLDGLGDGLGDGFGDSLGDSVSLGEGDEDEKVDVACGGLLGGSAVAEGAGHELTITSILWLPQTPTEGLGAGAAETSYSLYHLVTGSRDGELRQWCVTLPRDDAAPPPPDAAPDVAPDAAAADGSAPVKKKKKVREKVVPVKPEGADGSGSLKCVRCLVAAKSQVSSLSIFRPPTRSAPTSSPPTRSGGEAKGATGGEGNSGGWSVEVACCDVEGSAFTWTLLLPCSMPGAPPPAPFPSGPDLGQHDVLPRVLASYGHASVKAAVPLHLTSKGGGKGGGQGTTSSSDAQPFVLLALSAPFNSAGESLCARLSGVAAFEATTLDSLCVPLFPVPLSARPQPSPWT